ncbi:hypothetical protein JVU11DRAFT_12542 [Chiua virens]|nr:hypothetical protein JVU11DRAFT_12542 [Chiua virens]
MPRPTMNEDDFFAEQDRRMNLPNEDVDQFIQTRLRVAASQKQGSTQPPEHGVSREPASHSLQNLRPEIPPKRSPELKPAGENSSAETVDRGREQSPRVPFSMGESTAAAARCTKRRKTMQDYSERTSGQNGVSGSTGLVPPNKENSTTPPLQAQMVHSTDNSDMAVSIIEECFEISTHVPRISSLMDYSVTAVFSPPPTRRNAADLRFNPTTFDGHGIKSSESLKGSKDRTVREGVPEDGIPKMSLTAAAHHTDAPLSSTSSYGSHEAGCIRGDLVNTGSNTATVSKAMIPGDAFVAPPPSSNIPVSTEPKARKPVNSGRRTKKVSATSKQVKDSLRLVTPLEFAQKLQSCLDPPLKQKMNYLRGKHIFYVGGDMMYASTTTRGRMEYIVKHGGTLVPKYDPTVVTHIVTDAGVHHTLKALSLRSLSDIPDNIPTVTWDWVVSGYRRARKRVSDLPLDSSEQLDFEFMHGAFPERIDAGCDWENARRGERHGKADDELTRKSDNSSYISHISNFSQGSEERERNVPLTVLPPLALDFKVIDSRKSDAHVLSEKTSENEDPLLEYYAQARVDHEAKWNRDISDSDDGDDDIEYHRGPVPRRGFACDIKGYKSTSCVNQHIVDKLEELMELHKAKSSEDDRWRAYSYGKCIPALRNYPKPIQSFSEARSIRGVGEKTALKIMEIVNTGDLRRIRYENTEDVASTKVFQGIYGVGRCIAFAWFASGLRTLDDVRARKGGLKLSTSQEIGLKFYDDINSRMPREEARRIFEMIKPIAFSIDDKLFIEIMGSYRRGKADCGDIDILITRPTTDGKTHQGVLRTLLEKLHAAGIITEDLAVPDDFSDLELVYHGLCKLPEHGAKRRRIDFLSVPWVSRGAALLYYTFNRAMRLKANKHGYSLNQRGLYAGVLRDPRTRQKISEGRIVASETEEAIFKILGVPWQVPHERVRG